MTTYDYNSLCQYVQDNNITIPNINKYLFAVKSTRIEGCCKYPDCKSTFWKSLFNLYKHGPYCSYHQYQNRFKNYLKRKQDTIQLGENTQNKSRPFGRRSYTEEFLHYLCVENKLSIRVHSTNFLRFFNANTNILFSCLNCQDTFFMKFSVLADRTEVKRTACRNCNRNVNKNRLIISL